MKKQFSWGDHRNKDVVRSFVLPSKPIKNGIFLAGGKALCVHKAESFGLMTNSASILLVERDLDEFAKMKQSAPRLDCVQCIHSSLERMKMPPKVKFDFAYLDFFGGMSAPVIRWMSDVFSPQVAKGATIAVTQQYAARGSKLVPAQIQRLSQKEGAKIREVYGGSLDLHLQCRLLLLHRIFRLWDFDVDDGESGTVPTYQDLSHKMLVFKLVNFRSSEKSVFTPI